MKIALTTTAFLALATSSFAAELGPWIDIDGEIQFESLSFDSGGSTTDINGVHGDIGVTLKPGVFSGVPLGFDLDVRGAHFEYIDNVVVYGALTYQAGNSKFSLGAPRPVTLDYSVTPALAGSKIGTITDPTGSVIEFLTLILDLDTPVGARFDYEEGPLQFGASYHDFQTADATAMTFGARYAVNDRVTVFGTYETLGASSSSFSTLVLGTEAALRENLDVGAAVFTGEFLSGDRDGGKIWANYQPNDRLTLTGLGVVENDNVDIGVSAEYALIGNGYVQAGYSANVSGSNSQMLGLSVGWKF